MKKILALLLVTSTLACNTAKWCANHCPETIKTDSIYVEKEKVVPRDTLIYIPGDTIVMKDSVPCDDFIKEFGNTRTKVKVVVKNKTIKVEVINKPIVAKAQLFDHYKTIYEKVTKQTTLKGKNRKWLSFWESWAAMGIILLFIGITLIRWLKKHGWKVSVATTFPFISIKKEL